SGPSRSARISSASTGCWRGTPDAGAARDRRGRPTPGHGSPHLRRHVVEVGNVHEAPHAWGSYRAAPMKEQLTLALPKGRLLDAALRLLHELGVEGVDQDSRKLMFNDVRRGLLLLLLKPTDLPAYVLYGAAD